MRERFNAVFAQHVASQSEIRLRAAALSHLSVHAGQSINSALLSIKPVRASYVQRQRMIQVGNNVFHETAKPAVPMLWHHMRY